jgi:hypothetical protein
MTQKDSFYGWLIVCALCAVPLLTIALAKGGLL